MKAKDAENNRSARQFSPIESSSANLIWAQNSARYFLSPTPRGWRLLDKRRPERIVFPVIFDDSAPDFAIAGRIRTLLAELGIAGHYGAVRGLKVIHEPLWLCAERAMRPMWLRADALAAWVQMRHAAQQDNIVIAAISAFRSTEYQAQIVRRKLIRGQPLSEILQVSAAPGYSEHHSGCAIDVNSLEADFADTDAFAWLTEHAARFGFRMSFPKNNPHQIAFEPWHWCYVGVSAAEKWAANLA